MFECFKTCQSLLGNQAGLRNQQKTTPSPRHSLGTSPLTRAQTPSLRSPPHPGNKTGMGEHNKRSLMCFLFFDADQTELGQQRDRETATPVSRDGQNWSCERPLSRYPAPCMSLLTPQVRSQSRAGPQLPQQGSRRVGRTQEAAKLSPLFRLPRVARASG